MKTQKTIWDDIAPEWHMYKKLPSTKTIDFLKSQKGKILDLGSGSGRNMIKSKNKIYYLQDFSEQMLALAQEKANREKIKIETIQSPMHKIPIEDKFFDGAICISALHCVKGKQKRKKAIEELYRVLKPKAKAYISVWNAKSKRLKRKVALKGKETKIGWTDKGKRYYYLFDEKEIHDLVKSVGFKIISTHNSEMMINFIVQKT